MSGYFAHILLRAGRPFGPSGSTWRGCGPPRRRTSCATPRSPTTSRIACFGVNPKPAHPFRLHRFICMPGSGWSWSITATPRTVPESERSCRACSGCPTRRTTSDEDHPVDAARLHPFLQLFDGEAGRVHVGPAKPAASGYFPVSGVQICEWGVDEVHRGGCPLKWLKRARPHAIGLAAMNNVVEMRVAKSARHASDQRVRMGTQHPRRRPRRQLPGPRVVRPSATSNSPSAGTSIAIVVKP